MLALGRTLMVRPWLLMIDEPSQRLAPIIVEEIFRILKDTGGTNIPLLIIEQNARTPPKD